MHYDRIDINTTVEWFTPPYIFEAMDIIFDLDPASPGAKMVPWIPVTTHFTERGLEQDWGNSFVWLNPPYGTKVLEKWVDKFVSHGNGIILIPERTSTAWYQHLASSADLILMASKRIRFISPVREKVTLFPIGSHLIAIGSRGIEGLRNSARHGLGLLFAPLRHRPIANSDRG